MALSLQKFREIVFQLLFSHSFVDNSKEGIASLVMSRAAITKKNIREAQEKMENILQKQEEIDQKIAKHSLNYSFDRITRIEKTILRLGVYEILFSNLSHKIIISEAIRLTKKFASNEGANFINAILDEIYKEEVNARCISAK